MSQGLRYSRTWSVEGDEWIHYDCEWAGSAEGTMEVTLREPMGLRSGPWKVSLRVEGQPAVEAILIVEGDHSFWEPGGFLPCPDFD